MKIFISWSGDRSKQMAEALRVWLPRVLQAVTPWVSTHDIGKGMRWADELSKELGDHIYGVICLTPENRTSPWILYEAGALSKTRPSQTYTLLLGLSYAEVEQPLAQFNHTLANRDDILALIRTINASLEHPLSDDLLEHSFQTNWSYLEEQLSAISTAPPPQITSASVAPPESRNVQSMIEEMLNILRAQTLPTENKNLVVTQPVVDSNLMQVIIQDTLKKVAPGWTVRSIMSSPNGNGTNISITPDTGGGVGFSIPAFSNIEQIQNRVQQIVKSHSDRLAARLAASPPT